VVLTPTKPAPADRSPSPIAGKDVRPAWREAFRILRPGVPPPSGFTCPIAFLFDEAALGRGERRVAYAIPDSDPASLSDEGRRRFAARDEPLCFGRTLDDPIGGQLAAGLLLAGFHQDVEPDSPLARVALASIATRSPKPHGPDGAVEASDLRPTP